jgi:hypothetical protein
MASDTTAPQSYSGALEILSSDGELLGVITATIADLDAAVWSSESADPINLRQIDPGGETVVARLANTAHSRSGEVAAAHLELRDGHVRLAGNYSFHAPSR